MTARYINMISIIIFLVGFFLIILGSIQGDATGGIFFVVPFVMVSGPVATLGMLFIFLSLFLFQYGFFKGTVDEIMEADIPTAIGKNIPSENGRIKGSSVRGGGIIFLGPIPIVFGDGGSIRYLLPIALIILLLMIIAGLLR